MKVLTIKYKKLTEEAKEPFKKFDVDAGFDLFAIWKKETDKYIEYGTGLAFEIPVGYVGLLFPRSSVTKEDLILKNSVGVIDSGYLGEIKLRFAKYYHDLFTEGNSKNKINPHDLSSIDNPWINANHISFRKPDQYGIGERCGQIVFIELPMVKLQLSEELNNSERGTDGYGSSGK